MCGLCRCLYVQVSILAGFTACTANIVFCRLSIFNFTFIQVLVGTPGNEPEECARDFIKIYYYYYPSGVYWYDASNELVLETSVKTSHEVINMCSECKPAF